MDRALLAVSQLRERGFRVPRDVAVAGFDDFVMARLGDPPLTTVAQLLERLVESAMRLIAEQLAHRDGPAVTPLPARFVVRESCGCNDFEPAIPSVGRD